MVLVVINREETITAFIIASYFNIPIPHGLAGTILFLIL